MTQVEHRQLVNYASSIIERFSVSSPSSFATVSTLAWDLGYTAIFPSLFTSGCLHIISQEKIGSLLFELEPFLKDLLLDLTFRLFCFLPARLRQRTQRLRRVLRAHEGPLHLFVSKFSDGYVAIPIIESFQRRVS